MKILVTGAAGFIGFYVAKGLLSLGNEVVGIDNLNDYYDVRLKLARLVQLGVEENEFAYDRPYNSRIYPLFRFIKLDLADKQGLQALFSTERFDHVINLAAQAGVRYSLENPFSYVDSNLVGFVNLLECCRHFPVEHLTYASSSSVYGGNTKTPFSEDDRVDAPVSLYAVTKKSNELMASCYSKLYGISATGLRFFTVYGPWGRPDMAPILFTRAILVKVNGKAPVFSADGRRHKIYNIGCSNPVKLMDFIGTLEKELGCEAKKKMFPMQPGDVYQTYADTSLLEKDFGYKPNVQLSEGIHKLVDWWNSDLNPLK